MSPACPQTHTSFAAVPHTLKSVRSLTSGGSVDEAFVHAVRAAVVPRLNEIPVRTRLLGAKLVYGGGPEGVRGVCYYGAWKDGSAGAQDFLVKYSRSTSARVYFSIGMPG